jgi:hypothetical protein
MKIMSTDLKHTITSQDEAIRLAREAVDTGDQSLFRKAWEYLLGQEEPEKSKKIIEGIIVGHSPEEVIHIAQLFVNCGLHESENAGVQLAMERLFTHLLSNGPAISGMVLMARLGNSIQPVAQDESGKPIYEFRDLCDTLGENEAKILNDLKTKGSYNA